MTRPALPRRPRVPRARSEHNEQALLFQWIDIEAKRYPEMALIFAIPNGGFRHARTAALMKAEGVRRGVPDICWPLAKVGPGGVWAGLFIEMKVDGGRLSDSQKAMHAALHATGYMVVVCWSFEDAKTAIESYRSLAPALATAGVDVREYAERYLQAVDAQREKELTRRHIQSARGW
jgi:hypothetical protein